jgi:hypothetical protein
MNKHVKISLIVLVTVILLLAIAIPAFAGTKHDFTLTYTVSQQDVTGRYWVGTFEFTEGFEDSGSAQLAFTWDRTIPANFYFDGVNGDFAARSIVKYFKSEDGCNEGKIKILPSRGTGDYAGWGGVGVISGCAEAGVAEGTITGWFMEY